MYEKTIPEITALFEVIDRQTEIFRQKTGLRCKDGCGACCENPGIETTVAEVLPLAVHLWSTGEALSKLGEIRARQAKDICFFYEPDPFVPGQGRCGIYPFRPGICRLFGFGARLNKHGKPELMTCKIIKEQQPRACACSQEQRPCQRQAIAAH